MRESDVLRLRELGLTDEQILSVVGITCLFNFMNRLADGLGVDIDGRPATGHGRVGLPVQPGTRTGYGQFKGQRV